nr:hypothetical protein [Endozoicomonas sp.]
MSFIRDYQDWSIYRLVQSLWWKARTEQEQEEQEQDIHKFIHENSMDTFMDVLFLLVQHRYALIKIGIFRF